uniref:Uncharacterized protein n=1 Tax=Rhinopithecus roxellana TaxID=61622 RepID=A0A2K6QVR5_RHIRO
MWGLSWELLGYWLLPRNISAVSEMVLNLALPCPAPQEVGPMLCITPTPFPSGSKLDSANGRHQQKMENWEERLGSVSSTLCLCWGLQDCSFHWATSPWTLWPPFFAITPLILRVVTASCYYQLLGASTSFVGFVKLVHISVNHPLLTSPSSEASV